MAVTVKWELPDTSEVTYDKVYIYRANSQTGTFLEIANQLIADYTYTDMDGTSSHWYKVRFFRTSDSNWSDYSTAIQGGSDFGYCSPDDIYDITPLTTTDVSYTQLSKIIPHAIAKINADINVRLDVNAEEVWFMDLEKKNLRNGVNTTFYTKNWPIGDFDNDGKITTTDIEAFTISSNGIRTNLTVSSIDDFKIGKFTLSTAPNSSERLYIRYSYAPIDENTPHILIKHACIWLTAALASTKLGTDNYSRLSLGRMNVSKFAPSFETYMNRYNDLISQISELVRSRKGQSLLESIKNEPIL